MSEDKTEKQLQISPELQQYYDWLRNLRLAHRDLGAQVKTLMIVDPDGNHIAFAEALDKSMAR